MPRIARRDTSEAEERDRLAPQRSQQNVESDKEREAATAATAKDEEKRRGEEQQRRSRSCSRHVRFAKLFGEEAAQAMRLRPTRCPPDVVLETPYDADPQYHQDWTIVKGSNYDPEARAREKQLKILVALAWLTASAKKRFGCVLRRPFRLFALLLFCRQLLLRNCRCSSGTQREGAWDSPARSWYRRATPAGFVPSRL